jgi:hypothetical protein
MPLNEDGLEIGQPVDFETIVRIENARKNATKEPEAAKEQEQPARAKPTRHADK